MSRVYTMGRNGRGREIVRLRSLRGQINYFSSTRVQTAAARLRVERKKKKKKSRSLNEQPPKKILWRFLFKLVRANWQTTSIISRDGSVVSPPCVSRLVWTETSFVLSSTFSGMKLTLVLLATNPPVQKVSKSVQIQISKWNGSTGRWIRFFTFRMRRKKDNDDFQISRKNIFGIAFVRTFR